MRLFDAPLARRNAFAARVPAREGEPWVLGKRLTGDAAGSVILVPDSLHKYLEAYEAAVAEPRVRAPSGIRGAWQAEVEKLAAIRDGAGFAPYCEGDGCST